MTRPRRPPPVLLLWGEDPFLLREAALEALGGIRPREVEGGAWTGGELADLPASAHRELAAYLAAPAPDAALVLCATVPERGAPPAALLRLVRGVGEVREVRVPRKDLAGWVLARARAAGVDLAPPAAQALVETVGEDPGALDQAVRQLGAAFPGECVGRELVLRQFRGLGEQHVWDLCDRAFGKDLPGAVRALRSLLEARGDPLLILGGVAGRLRELLRVRALPERLAPAELARAAGLRYEWQARRLREQARRFREEELVALHGEVVAADRALKSGAPEDVVLAALVARVAGGGLG